MKIAFLKKSFKAFGGAENYLATLIMNLKRENHEIHVLSSNWSKSPGVICHSIDTIPFNSTLSTLSFNRNVARALKTLRPDRIISFERTTCQDIYRAGDGCHREWLRLRGMVEGRLKRLSFNINPLHRTLLSIEKEIFSKTPVIVANSNMVKKQIINLYRVPEEKIRVIYNGVDLKRFSPENRAIWRDKLRTGYSIPSDIPLILFVGSNYERKGLSILLSSLSGIDREIKLIVAGRGNTAKFQRIAERHGATKRVIFAGPQREIERFYAAADIFVLPTIYDPFSNATLEAMASGLPVITTMNNGVAELIKNREEGFALQDMLDSGELSEKINLAISGAPFMGALARKKAEAQPIEKAASEFMDLIREEGDVPPKR
ncbi:MAG TPA: glycosyltransferase family 1 protein [Nitrospirae bacterium]|nr:glycosyltransferase family 1 protein [Nitrospirota bacterium]